MKVGSVEVDAFYLAAACFLLCCLGGEVLWKGQNVALHLMCALMVAVISQRKTLDQWSNWFWVVLGCGLFFGAVVFTFKSNIQFPVATELYLEIFPELVKQNWHVAAAMAGAWWYLYYGGWKHFQAVERTARRQQ